MIYRKIIKEERLHQLDGKINLILGSNIGLIIWIKILFRIKNLDIKVHLDLLIKKIYF